MYNRILVPLDGSPVASSILPFVGSLARRLGSAVILLTVVSPDDLAATGHSEALDAAQGLLNEEVQRLTALGISAESAVIPGEAARQITDQAQERECGLIVIGTRGRSGLRRGLLGSVTDEVIRSSSVPVLALSPGAVERTTEDNQQLTSITVPLDSSPLAESILPHVEALARQLSLEVNLLRAVTMAPLAYYAGEAMPMDTTPVEEDLEKEAAAYLERVADGLAQKGLTCNYLVLRGSPGLAIADYLKDTSKNMVAICTHGRSGLERLLIASVADSIIRSAGVPVLVITPREP